MARGSTFCILGTLKKVLEHLLLLLLLLLLLVPSIWILRYALLWSSRLSSWKLLIEGIPVLNGFEKLVELLLVIF